MLTDWTRDKRQDKIDGLKAAGGGQALNFRGRDRCLPGVGTRDSGAPTGSLLLELRDVSGGALGPLLTLAYVCGAGRGLVWPELGGPGEFA